MIRMLRADLKRLWKSAALRLSLIGMLVLASMDYTVPLSRVIFLPMSMYGVFMGALVSVFVGTDFSDGFIRNKLLAADHRSSLVLAQILVSCIACAIVYAIVTLFTAGVGQFFFENNVDSLTFIRFFFLGLGMSLTTGCLYAVITLLCGNKTQAVILCMGLAFVMLFLAMHTNSILVQPEFKDGVLNPKYVGGIRRFLCGILHDLNPCGQACPHSSSGSYHDRRNVRSGMRAVPPEKHQLTAEGQR